MNICVYIYNSKKYNWKVILILILSFNNQNSYSNKIKYEKYKIQIFSRQNTYKRFKLIIKIF